MKKRLQGLVAGVLIGAMLTSGVVFAKQMSETAELFYNNIKIYIDGGEIVPKDANGNMVEPFTMNGTTYLPVRAISNAFGKDVEWDGATQSVYIGKKDQTKPDNYLDKIQYTYYEPGTDDDDNALYDINGIVTDFTGNTYTNGYLFKQRVFQPQKLDTPLNLQYTNFKGKISMIEKTDIVGYKQPDYMSNELFTVEIYGDEKLIYTSPLSNLTKTFTFDLNVKGVATLSIRIVPQRIDHVRSGTSMIALTDLALYK